MKNNQQKPSNEEKLLESISMSLYGMHLQSRCGSLSPARKAELEAAMIEGLMRDFNIDRHKALELFNKIKSKKTG